MIRWIGVLCGSSLAVVILLVMFGIPQFVTPASTATTQATMLPAIQSSEPQEPEVLAPAYEATEMAVSEVTEPASPVDEPAKAQPETTPIADAAPATESYPAPPIAESPAAANNADSRTEHWYAFWSPFRSEIAANGFVAELQRTTGLDYRVVRTEPGVYEVAFQ